MVVPKYYFYILKVCQFSEAPKAFSHRNCFIQNPTSLVCCDSQEKVMHKRKIFTAPTPTQLGSDSEQTLPFGAFLLPSPPIKGIPGPATSTPFLTLVSRG
jgi:hypothetical protein